MDSAMTNSIFASPSVILTGIAPRTRWTMSSRKKDEASTVGTSSSAELTLFSEAPQNLKYRTRAVDTLRWWALEEQTKSLQMLQCSNMTHYFINHARISRYRPKDLRLTGSGIAPGRTETAEYEGTLKIQDDFILGSSLPPETVDRLIADDAMRNLNSMEFEVTPDNTMPYYVSKTLSEHPAPSLNKPRTLQIHGSTLGTVGNATLKVYHNRTDFVFETASDTGEEDATSLKDAEACEAASRKALEDAWGPGARPMEIHSSFVGHLVDQGSYSESGNPEYFVMSSNLEEKNVGDDCEGTVLGNQNPLDSDL